MTDDNLDAFKQIEAGTTCFAKHAKYRLPCLKETCKMWINSECNNNCTFLAIVRNNGCAMTLQQIGDIYNLTRMRVCQIEKRALENVKNIVINEISNH